MALIPFILVGVDAPLFLFPFTGVRNKRFQLSSGVKETVSEVFLIKRDIYLTKATTKTKLVVVLMGIIEAGAVAIVNFGLTIGDAIF